MAKLKNGLRLIPAGVWGVSVANLLVSVSTSMMFSISPFYLTEVLGLSVLSVGFIEGFAEMLSQLCKLGSGVSGDFFKRKKPTLMVGFLLATISKPIFILAGGPGLVVFSKLMERVSNGIIATPRDAYIADVTSKKDRGTCFGIMMTFKTLGCTIGSWGIAGLSLWTKDYRMLLWFGFLPCLLAVYSVYQWVTEPKESQPKTPEELAKAAAKAERKKIHFKDFAQLSFKYWSLIAVAILFMCARFTDGFLGMRLKEIGMPEWVCYSTVGTFNLISAFCCLPIGWLSDRINRCTMLYFSFITLALSNLCFIFAGDWLLAMLGVLFWGAQRGTSQILFTAIISDEAPKKIRGTAIGLYYIGTAGAAVIAGALAGWASKDAVQGAFVFGLAASMLACLALCLRQFLLKLRSAIHWIPAFSTIRFLSARRVNAPIGMDEAYKKAS
ncbi:MAG: MFS transporter [Pseudomonadota bacterium]